MNSRQLVILVVVAIFQVPSNGAVNIELKEHSVVRNSTVYLQDIATISGGDAALRARCGEVDVAALESIEDEESVARSLIAIRLLIAGIDSDDIGITGADLATVRRIKNRTIDEAVVEQTRAVLATMWALKVDDISVQLTSPLRGGVAERLTSNFEIKPILSGEPKLGANQMRFGAYENGKLIEKITASLEISVQKELAIATLPLKAGTIIEDGHIAKVTRHFHDHAVLHSSSNVVGMELSRSIRPGQVINSSVLRPADPEKKRTIVVKRRSFVRLVASKGRLTVSIPKAEAMEDGAVGDTIRVRNLQSGRIVTGQVESDKSVKISL